MPKRSLKQRFFSPQVGEALFSPAGILLAGAGAAVGIVAGLPLLAAAAVGAAAFGARVAIAVPRDTKAGDHIDPFAVNDPWRAFVADAQKARRRFDRALDTAEQGPMRDALDKIGERLDHAVQECWRTACQGQVLADARHEVDAASAQAELDSLQRTADGSERDATSTRGLTIKALQAQLDTAHRLDATITDARDKLRLLDARLDECVARAVELAARTDQVGDVGGLGDDVEGIVGDMENLRTALEEVEHIQPGTA